MESWLSPQTSPGSRSSDITVSPQSPADENSNKRKRAHSPEKEQAKKIKTEETTYFSEQATDKPVFNYHSIRQISAEDTHSRYIDTDQLPLSFTPCQSLLAEDMNNMDYRVVPQPERVREKLEKASQHAAKYLDSHSPEKSELFAQMCEMELESLFEDTGAYTKSLTKGFWGSCFQIQTSRVGKYSHILQDVFTCGEQEFKPQEGPEKKIPYAGIFDGHGRNSENLAKIASASVMEDVLQCADKYVVPGSTDSESWSDTVIWNAHKVGFVTCDRTLKKRYDLGGTTASVSSIFQGHLWTANTGDSMQVLLKPDYSCEALTEAALPSSSERMRQIEKRGGTVKGRRLQSQGERSLGLARSLGDRNYHGVANPRPKIIKTTKPEEGWDNYFLIMGTDGLWNVTSGSTICSVIKKLRDKGCSTPLITQVLALAARKAKSHDDISVALIDLRFITEGVRSSVTAQKLHKPL